MCSRSSPILLMATVLLAFPILNAAEEITVHPDLARSLEILAETWKVMDRFRTEIWPGWDDYKDDAFFLTIPRLQDLLINPPIEPEQQGFHKLLETLEGRLLFLRVPGLMDSSWNGVMNLALGGIGFRTIQFRPHSRYNTRYSYGYFRDILADLPDSPFLQKLAASQQYRISLIVHEMFHRLQEKRNREKEENARLFMHPGFSERPVVRELREAEGKALAWALLARKQEQVISWANRFLSVRQQRRRLQNNGSTRWERAKEYSEGGAEYAATRMLHILFEKRYRPQVVAGASPDWLPAVENRLLLRIAAALVRHSSDRFARDQHRVWWSYYSGMAQGLILDRLCGQEWKRRFFDSGVYFETLIREYSRAAELLPTDGSSGREQARVKITVKGN